MSPRLLIGLFCAALVTAAGCSSPSPERKPAPETASQPAPWPLSFAPATVAVAADSGQPQITRSADGGAIVSWIEMGEKGVATLRFAERSRAGAWSAPQTVASGNDWFVSWADVPAVTRLSDTTLVAQWLKTVDIALEAYDLLIARSTDNGRTWSRPATPHHDKTRTQHGFASFFPWADASGKPGLGVIWLDGRDQELDTKDPEGGSMGLFYARYDGAGKASPEAAIDGRVCECCATSAAVTSEGPIVAFRDRSEKDVRDIAVSRFEHGAWTPAATVHADNWTIDACPVNGPSIAAAGSTVAVAWFVATNDDGHAFLAFSTDGGRTFGAPVRLDDTTSLGHVGVDMLPDGSAVASWVEFADMRSRLRVRRIEASGAKSAPVEIAGARGARVSGVPRLVRVGNELLVSWTESTSTDDAEPNQHVRIATAALPK
jgi:hypothetical protein